MRRTWTHCRGLGGRASGGRRAARGFTLLEVLLAIVIFAIVITILYQSFQQSFVAAEVLREKRDLYEVGRLTMDRIHEDLTMAVIFAADSRTRFAGVEDRDSSGNRLDTVGFSSLAHVRFDPAAAESDLCEVSYGYQVDRDTGVRTLFRREDPSLDDDPTTGGVTYPLAEGVKSLTLRYFDGLEWVESWSSAEMAKKAEAAPGGPQAAPTPAAGQTAQAGPANLGRIPLAVEVKLVLADPKAGDVVFTDLARLPLAKPASRVSGESGESQPPEAGQEEQQGEDEDEE